MLYKAFDDRKQHIDPWMDEGRILCCLQLLIGAGCQAGLPRNCSQGQGNSKSELPGTAYVC